MAGVIAEAVACDTASKPDAVALAEIPAALSTHAAFAPYREIAAALARASVPTLARLDKCAAGANHDPRSVSPRLVPPLRRALGALDFERRIIEHGELIVRPGNLHDTLNAVIWHAFPRSKRSISEIHVELGAAATANGRPRRRDILTLFDEAGAIILGGSDDLRALHERHEWRQLFVEQRAAFQRDCQVILFGHGTLEQLACNAHRGLTVKALWLPLAAQSGLDTVDEYLASRIGDGKLLTANERKLPLPILGIPGWFADNEVAACYDDLEIFRPLRPKQQLQARNSI